jgi:predicted metal-binding membrane protein
MDSTPRSPGAALSPPSAAVATPRDRLLICGCILLVTALAWVYLIHLARHMESPIDADMMAKMGMATNQPWTASDVFYTWVMWSVMMIGMMAASTLPVLLLFAGVHARRAEGGRSLAVLSFGLGYFAVWLGFSACAAMAQWALHQGALLSSAMATSSTAVGGAILVGAGVYQLSPLKGRCLTGCQSPLGFLMGNWRDGLRGAFAMGMRHGTFCLGCCWALMGVLFVVGVMNLVWVGVLTVFVLIEKIGPTGVRLARTGGAIMIALGVIMVSTGCSQAANPMRQSGYSSFRQARGSAGWTFGVRSSRKLEYGATNGSGADTVYVW